MIINHNLNAMNAHRMMNSNIGATGKSMEKLSSGLRINRAGDDAAGLAISEKMRGQIRGLDQASRNSQDGISMIQTAEGALNEEHSILQRMKELATEAANGTNTKEDTSSIQQEINQLTSEINRIGNTTEFNKQKVLQGGDVDTSKLGTTIAGAGSGTKGTPAKLEVADVSGLYGKKMTDILSATPKITLNGKDIDLTNTKALDGSSGTQLTTDEIMSAIQSDIDAVYDGTANGGVTFKLAKTDDGKGFTIESSEKGSKSAVTITANADSAALKLTKDGSTDSEAKGADEVKGSASAPTVAVAATASGVKIGANSFTIDAGNGNGANGNITIEIKQSANAGDASTAAFSNDGKTLTLTLDKGKNFTSSDIQKLIASANNDDNKPTYLDMTKFTVKADDAANDSIDASTLSDTATANLSGGVSLQTFTSDSKAGVTNGTDDVVVESGLDVSDHDHATHAISVLDKALAMVSTERGKLGAMQNRLEHTINNLNTSSENLSAAESRIRDVDMANEMMKYSKSNILTQASQAMIAQAKSQPEQVLQLLR